MSNLFKNHGTKILGFLVTLIGALGDCTELFKTMDSDPKHLAIYSFVVALGAAVIRRGFTNTANTPPAPPAGGFIITSKDRGSTEVRFLLLIFGLSLSIVACQALAGLTLDEKIAAAYGTQTAIVSATATAVDAHTLTSSAGQEVLSMAQSSRKLLDGARAMEGTDPAGAQSEFDLASGALKALQAYINDHLPKGT